MRRAPRRALQVHSYYAVVGSMGLALLQAYVLLDISVRLSMVFSGGHWAALGLRPWNHEDIELGHGFGDLNLYPPLEQVPSNPWIVTIVTFGLLAMILLLMYWRHVAGSVVAFVIFGMVHIAMFVYLLNAEFNYNAMVCSAKVCHDPTQALTSLFLIWGIAYSVMTLLLFGVLGYFRKDNS